MYLGQTPSNGAFKKLDNLAPLFDGVTTTFSLTSGGENVIPGTAQNLMISISNVIKDPGNAFTVSNHLITFSTAPLVTDTFFGMMFGEVGNVNTVTDGSVNLTTKVAGILPLNNGGTGGTSLKTVNGNDIVGSGDISTNLTYVDISTTSGTVYAKTMVGISNAAQTNLTLDTSIVDGSIFTISIKNSRLDNTLNIGSKTLYGPNGNVTGIITLDSQIRNWTFYYTSATNSLEII